MISNLEDLWMVGRHLLTVQSHLYSIARQGFVIPERRLEVGLETALWWFPDFSFHFHFQPTMTIKSIKLYQSITLLCTMKDREPPATFERAPYLYCRHRYRPQAQAVGTKAVAAVVESAGTHRAQGIHIDCFGEFLSKKYLRQISIVGSNE